MSRSQKTRPDETETFKTAAFQIHAPTKRKRAMLHDAMYRHHLACDRCLQELSGQTDSFLGKPPKEREQIITNLIDPIIQKRPLGSAAKSSLLKHMVESFASYAELRKKYEDSIKNKSDLEVSKIGGVPGIPSINNLISPIENWHNRLDKFEATISLEKETDARNELIKESKAGQLRPVQFVRYRKKDGFLILYSEEKNQYFVFLNLHSRDSRWARRNKNQKAKGKKLGLGGLIDIRTGEVFKNSFSSTGALFPINFGRDFQGQRYLQSGEPITAKLVKKGDQYFVHVAFSFVAKKIIPKTYLGVDRGIHNLASIAVIDMKSGALIDRQNFEGKTLRHVQKIQEKRQKHIQKKGKVYRQKTRRAESGKAIHHVANAIVAMAIKHQSKVVVENLTMSNRKFKGKRSNFNRMFNRAQFQKLLKVLEYKLSSEGLPLTPGKDPKVFSVNAAYTSQTCPDCGHCCVKNRQREDPKNRFKCQSCGFEDDADLNAARIIALRKKWREGLPKQPRSKKIKELVGTEYCFYRFLKSLA